MSETNKYDQELVRVAKDNLRNCFEKSGHTLYSLSRKCGLTENAINKIIFGDSYPRLDSLAKVCNAMGVNTGDIFSREKTSEMEAETTSLIRDYTGLPDPDMRSAVRHMVRELKLIELGRASEAPAGAR